MEANILNQRAKAFDYLFDAVVVTDLSGNVTDWNKGAERLYGFTRNEVIGKNVCHLHICKDNQIATDEIFSSIEQCGYWTKQIKHLRKDGSTGWVEIMVVPYENESGSVVGTLGINRDITETKERETRLRHLAHFDQLTNLPNRHFVFEHLQILINSAKRNAIKFGIMFVDLDNLKSINDEHGHATGDLVIQDAAKRIDAAVRESDIVARIGGDEFLVVVNNIKRSENIRVVAQHIAETLAEPFALPNRKIEPSLSVGVAIFPDDGFDIESLLEHADKQMYAEKREKRLLSCDS